MERTFGQNLRALRTERGLSQDELAALLGKDETLRRIRQGIAQLRG